MVDHIVSLVNRLPLSFFYWAWNPGPWWSATHIQNESLFLSLATLEILTFFLSCVSEVTLNLVKLTKKINYHKQWHYPHWVCFVILRPAFHEIADSLVGHDAGFCPNRFHYFPLHIRMMEQFLYKYFVLVLFVIPYLGKNFGNNKKIFHRHHTWLWCNLFFSDKRVLPA